MSVRTLISAGMLVTAGILLSRVLGFFRETMIAASYGTGADASMAIGLLIIPDYVTSILIGGALGAALLPAFSRRNEGERLALFWQAMGLSVVVFSVLALLIYSQSSFIISALHDQAGSVPEAALFWALFSMPLAGAGGVISAWLQYHKRLIIPAFANALFNLAIVLALWLAPSGFTVLGIAIFIAALARLTLQFGGFARSTKTLLPNNVSWQLSRRFLGHYASAVGNSFFSLLPQYTPYVIITMMAGKMALFNYAFKLVLLPGMLINTVIFLVLLPHFVHLRKVGKDASEYARTLRMTTTLILCVVLAASVAARDIVTLCFGYGVMTDKDISEVVQIFTIGLWALPGMVVGYLWQQIFYACEKPSVPLKIGVIQAVLCVPITWVLQQQSAESGAMLAYVIVLSFPVILFSIIAQKQNIIRLHMQYKGLLAMIGAAIIPFVLAVWLFSGREFSPIVALILALLLGAIMLVAAFAADKETRQWVKERMKHI